MIFVYIIRLDGKIINKEYNLKGDDYMPGYLTHYIFGKQEYKKLSESDLKQAVRENINVFNLGLQGPDIFFYYPGYFLINKKNLGSIMHRNKTGRYISNMLKFIYDCKDSEEKKICIAYLSGFLAHYDLDRTCHPYIYHKTNYMHKGKEYHGRHVALETDIDFVLCREVLKRKISKINYGGFVKLNRKQCKVVGRMLSVSCSEAFDNIRFGERIASAVVANMGRIIDVIKDQYGKKEKIIGKIEQKLKGAKNFAPLFVGDNYILKNLDPLNEKKTAWYNPWEDTISQIRYDSFKELMELASERYQKSLGFLLGAIQSSDMKQFVRYVGNKSFLSGLEIEEL